MTEDKPARAKTEIEKGNVTLHDRIVPLTDRQMYLISVTLVLAFTFLL